MKPNLSRIAFYPVPIRLGIFILTLLIIWLPLAAPIDFLLKDDPNLVTILTMGLLFIEFLFLLRFWGKKVYQQPHLHKSYGLEFSRKNGVELLNGLSIGILFTLALFAIEGIVGWVTFQTPSVSLLRIVAEGLLSALGIGLAEEFVFRGWLLNELERDYSAKTALWIDAILFAVLHFLKPIEEVIRTFPAFPGLLLLGLTLVWAKRNHRGRLGISIGLHAGLVWGYYIVNVGELIQYSDTVSPWITGVDKNPIAGILGLLFLSILAYWMRQESSQKL
ncbi:MAG: CPBP family intramembrane glutamic endopeptidase [Chroococcales cyanobacterium]